MGFNKWIVSGMLFILKVLLVYTCRLKLFLSVFCVSGTGVLFEVVHVHGESTLNEQFGSLSN